MIGFDVFASRFRAKIATVPLEIESVVSRGAELATAKAKSFIGIQQPDWLPLADSTKAEKGRLGYGGPPDFDPLLRRGDMRDSYEPLILPSVGGVASNSKIAMWQEIGTAHIPPRPVTAKAIIETIPERNALLEASAVRILTIEE